MRFFLTNMLLSAFFILSAFFMSTANAVPVLFSDRATFEAAVSNLEREGFEGNDGPLSPDDFELFSAVKSTTTGGGMIYSSLASQGTRSMGFQSVGQPTSAIITFSGSINAFGVDILDWATSSGNVAAVKDYFLRIENNTGSLDETLATTTTGVTNPNPLIFFGVIDSVGFNSITIEANTSSDTVGLDELVFSSPVPEPSAMLLFILALIPLLKIRNS